MKKAMKNMWIFTFISLFFCIMHKFDKNVTPHFIIFATLAVAFTIIYFIRRYKRKDKNKIAQQFKMIRISRNLTIWQVSSITGIPRKRIDNIEKNEIDPTREEFILLQKCYNISL